MKPQFLPGLLLLISFAIVSSAALSDPLGLINEPGGKGTMESNGSVERDCFTPERSTIHQVCTTFTINWKMWSLLGEPVGDYNVAWKLTSIQLMDPKRKLKVDFSRDTLPIELRDAADKIELYIDALAHVDSSTHSLLALHHFNTGVAVRANGGSSFNVPGSPNWDKLFMRSVGLSTVWACEDDRKSLPEYIDAKAAKAAFVKGFGLFFYKLCPASDVSNLSSLESAIDKLCEPPGADKQYKFCPTQKPEKKPEEKVPAAESVIEKTKQAKKAPAGLGESLLDGDSSTEPSDVASLLDESADHNISEKCLAVKMKPYVALTKIAQDDAVTFCTNVLKTTDECLKDACGNKPSETICTDLRKDIKDSGCPPGRRCIVFPSYTCHATGSNPESSKWQSCVSGAALKCSRSGVSYTSVDECVNEQVKRNVPHEADIKKTMQKECEQRKKTGASITNSILD